MMYTFLLLLLTATHQQTIDPLTVPKFVTNITFDLPVHKCTLDSKAGKLLCSVQMEEIFQQILPNGYPKTRVYVYGGKSVGYQSGKDMGYISNFPGPMFVLPKDVYVTVTWENKLKGRHMLPIEQNIDFMGEKPDWNNWIPAAVHIHGMPNPVATDGGPESYWTIKGLRGKDFYTEVNGNPARAVLTWANEQGEGYYFYHDHTIGMTRLNVYAGLAGPAISTDLLSPLSRIFDKKHDLIMAIADKSFYTNGSLYYPTTGWTAQYPVWVPQFFGEMMVVNGRTWPNTNIEKNAYRIRIVNACQGRRLILSFFDEGSNSLLNFQIVKVDQTYYDEPMTVTEVDIPVSGRVQLIVDFSLAVGQRVIMKNDINIMKMKMPNMKANSFNEAETIGKVMSFTLEAKFFSKKIIVPHLIGLNPQLRLFPMYSEVVVNRFVTLFEVMNADGFPIKTLINGATMHVDQEPYDSTKTYDLHIINLTPDIHPMHMHLINFQKWKQVNFDSAAYQAAWIKLNHGEPPYHNNPLELDPEPFFNGTWEELTELNRIFRDVDNVYPNKVTVFRFRFRHNDGKPFGFNIRTGKYVWHCHIIEHEDNEMMRYFAIT